METKTAPPYHMATSSLAKMTQKSPSLCQLPELLQKISVGLQCILYVLSACDSSPPTHQYVPHTLHHTVIVAIHILGSPVTLTPATAIHWKQWHPTPPVHLSILNTKPTTPSPTPARTQS